MPIPTTYTESQLCSYMESVLAEVAAIIGWDAGSPQVVEAANDALLELGVTDIAEVTTARRMRGLRALGRRAVWRAVVQAVSGKYDFRDSDATFSRSQIQGMALEALKIAEVDCLEFSPTYAATVVRISRPQDPYVVLEDASRVP